MRGLARGIVPTQTGIGPVPFLAVGRSAGKRRGMTPGQTLLLVDLSAIFYQAWNDAMPGVPAADRAAVARVRELAAGYDACGLCLDSYPNWRHGLAPGYKSRRLAKPVLFQVQFARVCAELGSLGFPLWKYDGMEADDVIASACRVALEAGLKVVIAASDKDLHQLVGDRVQILNIGMPRPRDGAEPESPMRGAAEVRAKYGVDPDQLGDWLALQGDSTDDVVGVPGLGAVTATVLLGRHKTLGRVLECAASETEELADMAGSGKPMSESLRQAILGAVAAIRLARELVTLRSDLRVPIEEAWTSPGDPSAAYRARVMARG